MLCTPSLSLSHVFDNEVDRHNRLRRLGMGVFLWYGSLANFPEGSLLLRVLGISASRGTPEQFLASLCRRGTKWAFLMLVMVNRTPP